MFQMAQDPVDCDIGGLATLRTNQAPTMEQSIIFGLCCSINFGENLFMDYYICYNHLVYIGCFVVRG